MRRWLRVCALTAAAALALTGCGLPEGTDGDVVDDWAPLADPVLFQPANGVCHPTQQETGHVSTYRPVDCAVAHQAETLYVGTFTGTHAGRDHLPPPGTPERRFAHRTCDREVHRVLGGDWRSGRLRLVVVLPSLPAWRGGARWFRCDLAETTSLDETTLETRTGSLRGALASASPLALGCFNPVIEDDLVARMAPVACTKPHDAEFAGVYLAPDSTYQEFLDSDERLHRECLRVIAGYAKVPRDGDLQYRAGSIFYQPRELDWHDGQRGVQCFLWVEEGRLTRSVKGGGPKVLPIRPE